LGRTPLHYACKEKHLEVISCLLEHGADMNIKSNVSTATTRVAVMVEMVVGGGEGWCGGGSGAWLCNVTMKWDMKWSDDMMCLKPAKILLAQ
jgi:hypothetical protein